VVIASVALVLLAPLLAAIWALVRIGSRGPAIYRGVRVGKAGRVFTMFKFRTLQVDAESRLGPYLGAELSRLTEDELTRVGRRLRAAHLDELPQLVNVLTGDMSIVGPRPIRPAFFEQLCEQIPQYWQRLVVPPGMTGFAQLRMTREMTWEEKLAHDLEYIADRSPRLYLGVVAETAASIPRRARAA
jgi:lipopolysaccharide/colanic/teichoic acid biosynthesis glycosyltransferase